VGRWPSPGARYGVGKLLPVGNDQCVPVPPSRTGPWANPVYLLNFHASYWLTDVDRLRPHITCATTFAFDDECHTFVSVGLPAVVVPCSGLDVWGSSRTGHVFTRGTRL